MTKLHRLLALAFAAALASCAQNGSISRDFQNPGYDPQLDTSKNSNLLAA